MIILIIFLSYTRQWSSSHILILSSEKLIAVTRHLLNVCCVQKTPGTGNGFYSIIWYNFHILQISRLCYMILKSVGVVKLWEISDFYEEIARFIFMGQLYEIILFSSTTRWLGWLRLLRIIWKNHNPDGLRYLAAAVCTNWVGADDSVLQ